MLVEAAEIQSAGGFPWVLIVNFAAPVSAIIAALIAAVVALRNARRKPPHERLTSLIDVLSKWPPAVEGRDTVERSVAFALAEIRLLENDLGGEAPGSVLVAEGRLLFSSDPRRRVLMLVLPPVVYSVATVLVGAVVYYPDYHRPDFSPPAIAAVVGELILMAGVIAWVFYEQLRWQRRREDWDQRSPSGAWQTASASDPAIVQQLWAETGRDR